MTKRILKLTQKVLNTCAVADSGFNLGYNENHTIAKYGVTHAQVAWVRDVTRDLSGMFALHLTLPVVKSLLDGWYVGGYQLDPDLEARFHTLFTL